MAEHQCVRGWNLLGDGSTSVESRSQQRWGGRGHHGCRFQVLEEGKQPVIVRSVESLGVKFF